MMKFRKPLFAKGKSEGKEVIMQAAFINDVF